MKRTFIPVAVLALPGLAVLEDVEGRHHVEGPAAERQLQRGPAHATGTQAAGVDVERGQPPGTPQPPDTGAVGTADVEHPGGVRHERPESRVEQLRAGAVPPVVRLGDRRGPPWLWTVMPRTLTGGAADLVRGDRPRSPSGAGVRGRNRRPDTSTSRRPIAPGWRADPGRPAQGSASATTPASTTSAPSTRSASEPLVEHHGADERAEDDAHSRSAATVASRPRFCAQITSP